MTWQDKSSPRFLGRKMRGGRLDTSQIPLMECGGSPAPVDDGSVDGRQPSVIRFHWTLSQLRATNTKWHPLLGSCIQWSEPVLKTLLPCPAGAIASELLVLKEPEACVGGCRAHLPSLPHPARFLSSPFYRCWPHWNPRKWAACSSQSLPPGEPDLWHKNGNITDKPGGLKNCATLGLEKVGKFLPGKGLLVMIQDTSRTALLWIMNCIFFFPRDERDSLIFCFAFFNDTKNI